MPMVMHFVSIDFLYGCSFTQFIPIEAAMIGMILLISSAQIGSTY
jgi:hypothetical protein